MWNVIYALLFRELKTRFGKNRRLGYIWVIGEPMAQIAVITTVISTIRNYQHQIMPADISIFMFITVGIIPFFMFRNTITQLMTGIQANAGLFIYKPVKPIHVFIARTLLESGAYLCIFIVLMSIVGWFGGLKVVPHDFLQVFCCFVLMAFSAFVLGLCLSIVYHFLDNVKNVLVYLPVILYIASAVIFPIWIIPEELVQILLYNPWLHIMELLKAGYFEGYPLHDGINIYYPLGVILALFYVGLWFYFYKRQELTAAKR